MNSLVVVPIFSHEMHFPHCKWKRGTSAPAVCEVHLVKSQIWFCNGQHRSVICRPFYGWRQLVVHTPFELGQLLSFDHLVYLSSLEFEEFRNRNDEWIWFLGAGWSLILRFTAFLCPKCLTLIDIILKRIFIYSAQCVAFASDVFTFLLPIIVVDFGSLFHELVLNHMFLLGWIGL